MGNVIGFVGSPRPKGNTDTLVRAILNGAASVGASTKTYYPNKLNIRGCQACDACKVADAAPCVIQDDMQDLYAATTEADAIIIGSPIYMTSPSAQIKLIIDRWYAFLNANFASELPKGKRFAVVLTYADQGEHTYNAAMESLLTCIKWYSPASIDTLVFNNTTALDSASNTPGILECARQLGLKLAGKA